MKRILAVLLCAVMILSMVSCAGDKDNGKTTEPETELETTIDLSQYATKYPYTAKDIAGREVTFDKAPAKIVCADHTITSLCIGLGLKDKLVGVEGGADKTALYSLAAEKVSKLPKVTDENGFDVDKCLEASPDLVLLPQTYASYAEELEAEGVKVIVCDLSKMDGFANAIIVVSKATDTYYKGYRMFENDTKARGQLNTRMAKAEEVKVYFAGKDSVLTAGGGNVKLSSLAEDAKGVNVAKELQDWTTVTYDQINEWNPQCIVITSDAEYTVEDVLSNESLSGCDAVKNKAVFKIPADIENWETSVIGSYLGAHWLAAKIQPNFYTIVEYNKAAKEFYGEFYGFTPENRQ